MVAVSVIGVALATLVGATAVGYTALYRSLYSPSAFVTSYLTMLAEGRTTEALQLPGVAVDSSVLESSGLDVTATDALLRPAALGSLTDIRIEDEQTADEITSVTASYRAGGHPGTTTFRVRSSGMHGLTPGWAFATSPLSEISLTVTGSMSYAVNGFTIDKRQVSPSGPDADPVAAIPMLVFTPGAYAISIDTPVATSSGTSVLADVPLRAVDVDVTAQPTPKFVETVQERVDGFLAECAKSQVLQPAGCPFGLQVRNRAVSVPVWSITQNPTVTVQAHGAGWIIPSAAGTAHITVEIQSLFDGEITDRDEDVPFLVGGQITMMPDGSASIKLTGSDPE